MRAGQISNLVRIANVYVEAWLCCLLYAHAGLRLSLRGSIAWRLNRWRDSGTSRGIFFIIVEAHRVHHAPDRRSGSGSGWARSPRWCGLFLRRRRRCFLSCRGRHCSQRTQRIVYSLQACGLSSKLPPPRPSCSWRTRRGRGIRGGALGRFGRGQRL